MGASSTHHPQLHLTHSHGQEQSCLTTFKVPSIITSDNMPASSQVEMLSAPEQPFDFESDPIQAMTIYSRDMFSHTKQQMASACSSSRRHSGQRNSPVNSQATLSKEST